MSSMEDFLQDLGGQGRFFETSEFTIDSFKARAKLSRFQLPDSGLWVVKLIQAAVASGASGVDIRFSRNKVTIRFGNNHNLRADELLQGVLSGELPSDRVLLHLFTGLRATASSVTETVTWSCGGAKVILDGKGSSSTEIPVDEELVIEATRPNRSRSLKKMLTSSVSHLARQTVEEHEAIEVRCWPCPIPIVLDGKLLDRGYHHIDAGYIETNPWAFVTNSREEKNKGIRAALFSCPMKLEKTPSIPLDYPIMESSFGKPKGDKYRLNYPVYLKELFLLEVSPQKKVDAVLVIHANYNAESTIDYLQDGALVSRYTLPLVNQKPTSFLEFSERNKYKFACRCLVSVEPDELDLSQFQVRDPRLEELRESIIDKVIEACDTLKSMGPQFLFLTMSRGTHQATAVVLGLPTVAIALTNAYWLIPFGFVAGTTVTAFAANYVYRSKIHFRKGLAVLREQFEASRQSLEAEGQVEPDT